MKDKYMYIGIAVGVALGISLGLIRNNMNFYLPVCLMSGLSIGLLVDNK